ncbi:MAG: NTP transferase domain-containing protein [Bacteroidetes bacterium]|nr:NTP transferase domain-containing protein [Bacteroidota bacterium]
MKLIIPMAGKGTRLRPHSHTTPKPLLPVVGKMIIERIIETFNKTLDRNIEEIVFILGDFGDDVKTRLTELCGQFGAKSSFYKQDIARGTAHAVYCAADKLEGEIIVVFADTLFDVKTKVTVDDADSVIWLKEVENPRRFGVAIHQGERITDFVEKPSEPISNLAIIGVYYFKKGENLKAEIEYLLENNVTGHGNEYQLTDALDRLLKDGKVFKSATVDEWLDCGTIDAWLETSGVIAEKEQTEINDKLYTGCTFTQPVYIAKDAEISNSHIGPNVTIDANTHVFNSKIVNSIVLTNTKIESSDIHDSTIGNFASVKNATGILHIGDHCIVK